MAEKVLIVDDEVDCLELTRALLLEWDDRVIRRVERSGGIRESQTRASRSDPHGCAPGRHEWSGRLREAP